MFNALPVPRDLHHFVLDVLSQPLLQGLGNHGDLIPVNHITEPSITHCRSGETLGQREGLTLTVTPNSAQLPGNKQHPTVHAGN